MEHPDHVALIRNAIPAEKGIWADLGSGEGAFTLALADLTRQKAEIYSVDKDARSLRHQKESFAKMFPETKVHFIQQDFSKDLDVPKLDGIVMANSLHYIKDQISFLKGFHSYLKPGGRLVIVEYNSNHGNMWVPYPFRYERFVEMAKEAGYENTELTGTIPSQFLGEIYSAVTWEK